eukprot:245805_1
MAQDDWDAASFATHNQYYNDQSTTLFSQMHEVEIRFRALREHLNGNIPHDIKANEQEMEDRIEKIRHLQNDIFKMQFKQFSVHEFKAKSKDKYEDPFDVGININSKNKQKNKSNKMKNKNKENKDSKINDINNIEIEEKKSNDNDKQPNNPFLDEEDEDAFDDEKNEDLHDDQYAKYQDILDSFEIEQNTTTTLLKKLRATTTKMKELNDLALGNYSSKHRQHQ